MFSVRSLLRLLALFCLTLCLFSLPALAEVTEGYYSYHYDESIGGVVITSYVGMEADVTVPDTLGGYPVRKLSFASFNGLSALTTVRLPDSMHYMDGGAFIGCSNLTTLYLPENLLEFHNASVIGNYTTYVGKDTPTAKLLINEAGSYPSARFVDPDEPDMQIYFIANANTGELELGLYNYMGQDEIVHVPDGVMHLYDQVFRFNGGDNASIRIIYTPDSVVSVGMQTFYFLPNLEEVHLSANISTWKPSPAWAAGTFDERNNPRLFCRPNSITARTMTSDITSLGITDPADPDFAWKSGPNGERILAGYYGNATHLTIPDGTAEISAQAFYNNSTLVSVVIPNGCTTIGNLAFYGIKPLSSVVIPDSVTYIGDSAFEAFEYWEDPNGYAPLTLTLPNNVSFGSYPFNTNFTTLMYEHDSATARNIMALNHESGEVMYNFIDPDYPDFLLAHFENELYLRGYIGADSFMDIPPIVEVIEGHINLSTPNCDSIKHIRVPEGVRRLAARAFAGFPHTDFISLPSSLETIGEYAFSSCSMKALVIPEGVTSLPAYMTENSIIRYVTIPKSVTSIHSTALTTSGSMRVYKIYCNKGSYAEKWAKSKSVPISYLENAEYTIVAPEQNNFDVGEYFDWRASLMFMPVEPDTPYTLTIESSNPKVARIEDSNEISFIAPGSIYLTITSPELETSVKMPNIHVYQPIKSFTLPEYHFVKYPNTKGVLSVSNVVPSKDTNPTYLWVRHDSGNLGKHTAGVQDYALSFISEPGVYSFDVTSHSGITHRTTLIYSKSTDSFTLSLPSEEMTIGLTITPQIAVTIGQKTYKNISASYTLTSSNSSIVKVTADGRLKLLAPGTVTITAKSFCGDTVTQKLTVSSKKVYTLPDSTLSIDTEAFAACPADKIIIPDGCIEIGSRAFADCSELTEIVIPLSVTSIAGDAFSGSSSVTIFTPDGSYAASYAALHGIPCTSY